MDDDFTFEVLRSLFDEDEEQKRLQDEFICILTSRFPPLHGEDDEPLMIQLLKNAAESLNKDNPFPTFEVKGTLDIEDFYYDDEETIKYGSGFYVFQTTETTSQRTYISLAYCAVDEAKKVYRNISLNADSDNTHKLRKFSWVGLSWGGENHIHRVSFLGTSCADSPLKGTGILNWVTF